MWSLFQFLNQTVKPPKDVLFERFLEKIIPIFGDEPEFWLPKKQQPSDPLTVVVLFKGVPDARFLTAVTYGLSLQPHREWPDNRPELCLVVQSQNENWGKALGHLVSRLRGDCPFVSGQLIRFGTAVVEEAAMDAFFVWEPWFLAAEERQFDIGLDYQIRLQALYPIRESEALVCEKIGPQAFVKQLQLAPFDVDRPEIH